MIIKSYPLKIKIDTRQFGIIMGINNGITFRKIIYIW